MPNNDSEDAWYPWLLLFNRTSTKKRYCEKALDLRTILSICIVMALCSHVMSDRFLRRHQSMPNIELSRHRKCSPHFTTDLQNSELSVCLSANHFSHNMLAIVRMLSNILIQHKKHKEPIIRSTLTDLCYILKLDKHLAVGNAVI